MKWRAAGVDDFDAVAFVWHESARNAEGAAPQIPTLEELRSRIDRELAAGWKLSVCVAGDEIIGMLALQPDIAVLDQLFILPRHQARGVGLAGLQEAMKAMPQGFSLRTASGNYRARRFYERAGMSLLEEGTHPTAGYAVCYYGWGAAAGARR